MLGNDVAFTFEKGTTRRCTVFVPRPYGYDIPCDFCLFLLGTGICFFGGIIFCYFSSFPWFGGAVYGDAAPLKPFRAKIGTFGSYLLR